MHEDVPRHVKIGPYHYNVVLLKEVFDSKGNKAYGRADYAEHNIVLDINNTVDRMKVVFWHEMFHCILEAAGFGDEEKLDEEEVILRASPFFVQVLVENPIVRDYYAE